MIEKIQIVHNDFRESFEEIPLESVGRLMLALMAFANDEDYSEIIGDDAQVRALFPTVKAHIVRQEEFRLGRANNGSKGGAPKGNQNAKKTTKNNLNQPKTTKNNQKQAPNPNPIPIPNPIPNKRQYGECQNVFLTDEEYSKIKDKGFVDLIEELSLYIASKGDKYKNHYAVICQWANRRKKENKVVPFSGDNSKNQFNRFTQRPDDYDYSKLIKN